jgi:Kef-type K+ transport system membrane component KefB/Trk K+ transport system NAD-binding subunit
MTENIFLSLGVVLWTVLVTMGIMKFLKQPMIIAYIVAGILLSIFLPNLLHENMAFESFSRLWIAFLLFIVGMELNPTIIKEIGKSSIIAGFLQVFITTIIGIGISLLLGFDTTTSVYIGIGFSFSSTIVVLKLLGDKEEMESIYGRQSIGILIVQDIIVMLIMLGIVSIKSIGDWGGISVIFTLILKLIGGIGGVFLISKYLIPKITKKIAESQEFLFLFSIGWCFILGAVFHYLGFGIEIWALAAGISLASSSYRFEMTSRIKPIKDFFLVIFFVLLWSHIHFSQEINILKILVLSAFVLIIKPIIIMLILGYMRHTKKNNFLTWTSLGQISEFSFIIIWMGIASWAITDPNLQTVATIIGLITITGSSYYIMYGEKFYEKCKGILKYMPGVRNKQNKKINTKAYDIILFGYGRFWWNIYKHLIKKGKVVIIDENPSITELLQNEGKDCIYWDASDIDFLQELNVKQTKMIISSIKKFDENMVLLKTMKNSNKNLIIILVANYIQEAIKLYEQGADYVILPHYIGVDHTSLMLEEYGFDLEKFMQNKNKQFHQLKEKDTKIGKEIVW